MVTDVRVKAHTRRRSAVDREAHKTWGELKAGFHGIGRDLKRGGRKTKRTLKRGGKRRETYTRRTPYQGPDRLSPKIAELREALDKRVGAYGSKKGVPISEAEYKRTEDATRIDFTEHAAYQDTQAWAHASGIISYDEAQLIYRALGEVGNEDNGGWAAHTDLATKIIVTQIITELLGIKIKMKGTIRRRAGREWYVRGVDEKGHVTSGTLIAEDHEEAREEFREKHPGYKIVQLNARE